MGREWVREWVSLWNVGTSKKPIKHQLLLVLWAPLGEPLPEQTMPRCLGQDQLHNLQGPVPNENVEPLIQKLLRTSRW